MSDEQARDSGLSLQEENERVMLECIDRFYAELCMRSKVILELASLFEPLEAKSLLYSTEEELNFELSNSTLFIEISSRMRRHLKAAGIGLEGANILAALDFLTFIMEWDIVGSLPTLSLGLQLFLTICVSLASCDRSFSKRKLMKNYLRSTMGQSKAFRSFIITW
ncbi:uncharacterized protein LOC144126329 [Amblyomma americanum]